MEAASNAAGAVSVDPDKRRYAPDRACAGLRGRALARWDGVDDRYTRNGGGMTIERCGHCDGTGMGLGASLCTRCNGTGEIVYCDGCDERREWCFCADEPPDEWDPGADTDPAVLTHGSA